MTDPVRRHNVSISGRGRRTMMFAHGYGCDQNMWRKVAPAFEKDFRVVLFDYVGFGHAGAPVHHPRRSLTQPTLVFEDVEDLFATGVLGQHRGRPVELAFNVEENHWNGRTSLQLKAKDVRLQDE